METSSTRSSSTSSSDRSSTSTSWVSWSSASIPTSSGHRPSLSPVPDCQDCPMAQPRALAPPTALRPAPTRATTPLPASFTLREDPSTQAFDGGTVLLGGSPLRLFRISERARQLVDLWKDGAEVGPRRSAQQLARRLASGGAFNPQPSSSTLGLSDVTVVVPAHNRPEQLDRLLE